MAQPRHPQLYIECRITHQQAEPSGVDVYEPEAPELGFEVHDAAGAAFHETENARGLSWTINQEEPSRLHLRSFNTTGQPQRQDLTLSFAQALLAHVAIDTSHVYAITCGGFLHSIQLLGSLHAAGPTGQQPIEVPPTYTPLTAEFQRLGAPTSLILTGSHICIGTQSGAVLGVPKASAQRGSADFTVELKPPAGVGRLLTSLFARASSAAVTCMAAVELAGHSLLAAAYSDASLRLWDLSRQACLLHSPLLPSGAQEGAALPTQMAFAPSPADEPGRPGKVVVQLDELGQDSAATSQFIAFELYGSPGTMSSLSGVDMQQVSILEPLSTRPLARGRVKSLAAQQRAGGRVRAWVLDAGGVPCALDDSPFSRGLKGAVVQLETHAIASIAQTANPLLQEELWGQAVAALEDVSGRKVPEDLVLSTLAGVLVSTGSLSLPALRAALSALGRPIPLQELRQMGSAALKQSVAQALGEAAAAQGSFAAVQKLYRDYLEAERSHSAVMALCLPPGGAHAAPFLIRRGPALSCLQPAEPVTALSQGACAPEHHASSQAMQRIAAASNLIRDLIGPFCSTLATALLERGFDLGREVLPAIMHALAAGPGAAAPSHGSRSVAASPQGARSHWRRQRSKLALDVGALLEHVQPLDEALSRYASLLDRSSPTVGPPATGGPTQTPDDRTLAVAAGQAAAARSQAAASLLMLLAYIGTTRSLGVFTVSCSQLQHMQQSVVPAVEAALRQAEIVRWLASNPAQRTDTPGRDPSALLHRLQLGQASAAPPAGHQVREKVLAEALLAARSSAGQASAVAAPWGPAAEDILLEGCDADASMTDEDTADLSAKVGNLGMQLLEAKQVSGLLPVLRLAGSVSEEPHLQFLKGYAALDQLRSTSGDADRAAWLDMALGPLFRAAGALGADTSAGSARSIAYTRRLLYWLWKDATAAAFEEEGPQGQQLQYFEALMLVCQRLGCPEGAAQFAQAAVHQADAAYPAEGGNEAARQAREGRLWTSLFVNYLESGRMEAAYAAMQATPVPERQLDSLQRLLGELCRRGDIATLVQLPLSGVIQLDNNGRAEVRSVGDEALSYLRRRADVSDLAAAPQPYQVLYCFCVSRSCFREAAAAQLAFARRLRDENPQQLDLIICALSVAANALSLVDPVHAWLEDPAGPDTAPAQRAFLGSSLPEGPYLPAAQHDASPRSPLPDAEQQDALDSSSPEAVHLLTPGALMKEVAGAHAMRSAGMHDFDAAKPMDLVHLLLGQKQVDAAWQLASSILQGAELRKALDYIIRALAEDCVHAQHQEGASTASSTGRRGSAASWRALQRRLSDSVCGGSAGMLRIAAVDAILSADRRMSLPAWLLAPYQVQDASKGMAGSQADPAALLHVLMKHGRMAQAATLALQYLRAWQTEVLDSERQRHAAVWFPHDLLGDLASQLAGDRAGLGARLHSEFDSALRQHRQAVEEQSFRLQQQQTMAF